MSQKGFDEHATIRYGTVEDLERLTRKKVTVSLVDGKNYSFNPGILDDTLVETRPAPGYHFLGCIGSDVCPDAYNTESAHEVVEQLHELGQMLAKRPELARDQLFCQKVAAACEYAHLMSEVIDIIDANAAFCADQLELKLGLS